MYMSALFIATPVLLVVGLKLWEQRKKVLVAKIFEWNSTEFLIVKLPNLYRVDYVE